MLHALGEADARGWERFHLTGYSAGGAAALAVAARHPDRLLSLALLEPAWAGHWDVTETERVASAQLDELDALTTADDFMAAFGEVDVILGPTTPNPAWKLGEKNNDPVAQYLEDIYTITANLAGLPGLSMPAGFVDGLPVGVQLLAPYFQEGRLLNVAHQYQQATDWHKQAPAGF